MHKESILGCGWLGLPLAKRLIELGYAVKGSTTSKQGLDLLARSGVEPYQIDIGLLTDNVSRFLESPTLIIDIPTSNLSNFQKLLSHIDSSAVKKVLFVSSTSVYREVNRVITEEDGLESPDSPWTIVEMLFRASPAFQTTIVRFGGLFGFNRNPARFHPPGKSIPAPESRVNMIHRDDCVAIIERILERDIWGETFNCCSDNHPTKREFYTKAAKDAKLKTPIFDEEDRSGYKIISNANVKRCLGFEFAHDLI
ncbi:MAG: SDR family NAD(P)-dependent oxidoreductase [Actinomycetia bacterium]|nr:SDR family NAD(P)-dependent oxidoreductase [Actinomycetes bacterium]